MSRPTRTAVVGLVTVLAAGCAAFARVDSDARPDPEQEFRSALLAWQAGDYRSAHGDFARLAGGYQSQTVGRRALLALAASALDPRNPLYEVEAGSRIVARYVQTADSASWTLPVAEALYLMTLELGATPADSTDALPDLPRTPLAVRLARLEAERDTLRIELERERATLTGRLAELEQKVEEQAQELERIRKTLKH